MAAPETTARPPARRPPRVSGVHCAIAVLPAGLLLFLAPMKAVLRARSERVLGVSEGEGRAGCVAPGLTQLCAGATLAPCPALPALTPAPSTVHPLRRT